MAKQDWMYEAETRGVTVGFRGVSGGWDGESFLTGARCIPGPLPEVWGRWQIYIYGFQIFFTFNHTWGNGIQFDYFFSNGLVQPPTSYSTVAIICPAYIDPMEKSRCYHGDTCNNCLSTYPLPSVYGIFTYIYHISPLKTTIHVGKYTIHGWYGYVSGPGFLRCHGALYLASEPFAGQ